MEDIECLTIFAFLPQGSAPNIPVALDKAKAML